MILWHIIARELRSAARRPATYWARTGAALVGLVILCSIGMGSGIALMVLEGRSVFIGLAIFSMVGCLLSGAFLTGDSVSSERREGTIDLLLLTDLRPIEVLVGKLAATLAGAFCCLLALFPLMALAFLLGGVSGGEFVRVLAICVATAFYSMSAGLFASAISTRKRSGAVSAFLLILIPGGLCPFYWWAQGGFDPAFAGPLPLYGFFRAFDALYSAGAFGSSLISSIAAGLLYIWGANRVVTRFRGQEAEPPRDPNADKKAFLPPEEPEPREKFDGGDPALWLALRDPGAAHWLQPVFVVGGILILMLRFLLPAGEAIWLVVPAAYALHACFKIALSIDACRALNAMRRSGELELAATTPLTPAEFLEGWRVGLKRRYGNYVKAMIGVHFVLWLMIWAEENLVYSLILGAVFLAPGIAMLKLDFHLLTWIGMRNGLRCKTLKQAAARTLASLYLPALGSALGLLILSVCVKDVATAIFSWIIWSSSVAILSATSGHAARNDLMDRFRALASQEGSVRANEH